ncbi:MAG: FecR family protein [Steroidobacteraceae bacterium]
MSNAGARRLNTQIYEEATNWFVEFRAGDADEAARRVFSEWVRVSPQHVRAYLEIAAIWNEGAALDPERRYGDEELVALAVNDTVVSLPGGTPATPTDAHPVAASRPAFTRRFAMAATVLLAMGVLFSWLKLNEGVFRTGAGEQRSLVLADGSTVQLNSRSKLRVRFGEDQRDVELLEGQALFQVAKDAERPFVVKADGVAVRAVGTQFDVYKRKDSTTVTVLEGKVEVASDTSAQAVGKGIVLAAGEQVTVTSAGANEPRHADVAAATAWTQRRIVFDSATIADVAQEFNRYNARQIVLQDTDMTYLKNSVEFTSTDPTSLIRFLRERPGIAITETDGEIQVSRAQ